ncbi:substrate-binding domain-containing protein [Paenibacillus sp. HJGM_3]|uniref:AraC family transcriptional regulator n=1 Tax=Paenibacillus sp. HJGM_3 TaxID=3379816 RepID=UPI00385D1731
MRNDETGLRFLENKTAAGGAFRSRHVALLIETSNEYARGLLRGIRSYIREHKPWSLYMGEMSRDQADLSWLHGWSGDGIIARIENAEIADRVRELGLPAVDLSARRLLPELPCVETDDEAIAKLAFSHLAEKGFTHFAYCGDGRFAWSKQRQDHFIRIAAEAGSTCSVYEDGGTETWSEERSHMAQWVQSLPKPAGIMACYDIMGQKLLESCRLAGVAVPDEVGIVGVDNDDLLCNLSDPPLSSVMPNTHETGYRAASLLDRMMAGEQWEASTVRVPPIDIVARLSTDVIAVDDRLVAEAVRLIREHLYEDMNVDALFRRFEVSRRSLESRFVRSLGRTPHAVIMEMKVKLIKQFLSGTDLTLPKIAERIGFKNAEYMSVLFKRETGLTPNAYRVRTKSTGG